MIARTSGTDIRYYHFDALGSTRLLTDSSGNITDKYSYDAYGSLISHDEFEGSIDQPYQYVGQYGYYTHYQEPEFGLMQLGVRFYDPQVGRFGQIDEILRVVSNYMYAMDKPVKLVDPSGYDSWLEDHISGSGMICVDSSCEGSPAWKKVSGKMQNAKQLGRSGSYIRLPNPPSKCKGKTRHNCAETDGVTNIPSSVKIGTGVPRRPKGKDDLKIRGGTTCTFKCTSSTVTVTCIDRGGGIWPNPIWGNY